MRFFISLSTLLFACSITYAQSSSEPAEPKGTEFYAGAALNITHIKPGNNYAKNGGKSYTSSLPALIVGINAYPRPLTRRAYFGLELSLGQNKYLSVYDNKVSPYTQLTYGYTQTVLSAAPQVNINLYNAENFKWFVGVGVLFQRNFYSQHKLSAADGSTFGEIFQFDLSKNQNRIMTKSGFTINKQFQIFGQYLTPVVTSRDIAYFTVSMQTTTVGVNYLF
jgi:hypothetical protein